MEEHFRKNFSDYLCPNLEQRVAVRDLILLISQCKDNPRCLRMVTIRLKDADKVQLSYLHL
jgi:hypothetical protein